MPHALALLLAGAGLWAAYRLMRKEMARVEAELRRAEEAMARRANEAPRQTLVRDPVTGTYRPAPAEPPPG